MKATRKNYVEYLNECSPNYEAYRNGRGGWFMGGLLRIGNYGALLRKYDSIAFEVGFNEWCRQ